MNTTAVSTSDNLLKNFSTQELVQHGASSDAALAWRQFFMVFRISMGKFLFSKQSLMIVILALVPMLILFFAIIIPIDNLDSPLMAEISNARKIFAFVYSTFILGAVIFLGSAALFTSAFRGEVLERSIHYYLLAPIRREWIVLGKYAACLLTAIIIFSVSTVVSYLLIYVGAGSARLSADIGSGIAISQLTSYLVMTLLACIGYGSLFMAIGLLFRNPLLPFLFIAGWEIINAFLPAALKYVSVIYYVTSRMPIVLTEGPFAIIATPMPVWASFLGVFILSSCALYVSVLLLKRMEVKYLED